MIVSSLSLISSVQANQKSEQKKFLIRLINENNEVSRAYENCREEEEAMDCVWGRLNESTRSDIQEALRQIEKKGGENQEQSYRGVDLTNNLALEIDRELPNGEQIRDAEIEVIGQFFGERLREALFGQGKDSDKRIHVVDHSQFYELYKTQISKNVIEIISSFCIEAIPLNLDYDKAGGYTTFYRPESPEKRAEIRAKYIQLMQVPSGNQSNMAYDLWGLCARNIQPICEGRLIRSQNELDDDQVETLKRSLGDHFYIGHNTEEDKQTLLLTTRAQPLSTGELLGNITPESAFNGILTSSNINLSNSNDEYRVNTRNMACAVASHLDASKRNIAGVNSIQARFRDFQKENCTTPSCGSLRAVADWGNSDVFVADQNKGTDFNSLTTMTSKDTVSEKYVENVEKRRELMNECLENRDRQACAHFLRPGQKDLNKEIDELELRSIAMGEKIKEIDEDEAELRKYLEEEGFSDNDIERFLSDPEKIQERITARYESMRQSLIENLRLEAQTRTRSDDIDFNNSEQMSSLETIQRELEHKVNQTRDIVHFNNIISGYLTLTNRESSESSRNTASLFAELDGLHADFSESQQDLQRAAEESGLEPTPRRDDQSVEMEVETLNQFFLGY